MKLHKCLKSIGIVTIVSVGLFGCAADEQSYSPEQVIQNTLADSKKISSYYAESVIKSSDETSEMKMKEWFAEDGKNRVETEIQDTGKKSIAVNDGNKVTTYDETTNTAYVIDTKGEMLPARMSPKEQAGLLLDAIKDTHTITLVGEEKILDRDVYHLKAEAKEKSNLYGDQEIWVDKETWFVLKSNSTSGDFQVSIEYKKIDFSPTFEDSLFKVEVPKDVKVENLDESIKETEVQSLEEVFTMLQKPFLYIKEQNGITIGKISVLSLGEELGPQVTIQYMKDNLPYFSLDVFTNDEKSEAFDQEAENIRGFKGEKTDMEGFRSLTWSEDSIGYSVMLMNPDLTFEQIKEIIAGMEYMK